MKFVVSVSGYGVEGAKPVTLACFHVKDTDFLVVEKTLPFIEVRPEGFALVTNLKLQTRDFLFTDEHIRDSIRDYFARYAQELIDIDDSLMRYKPDGKIDRDGIDERGPKFRLSPEVGNGEVAILAAVAFVTTQSPINDAIQAMGEFTTLYNAFEI